jgi:Domain of unknown function (DUF4397)
MKTQPLAALFACAAALALSAPPAAAQPEPGASAMVRGAHFSPDTPNVDVYLTAFKGGTTTLALSDVGYGDISDFMRIDPGLYTVGMRPAGADASTPVVFSYTLDAQPGKYFTAVAIGMNESLQGRVLAEDFTAPPPGQTRVRVIQAASRAPRADITAENGTVFGDDVAFGSTTDYKTVAAGSFPVTARSVDDTSVSTTTNLTLDQGHVTTVALLDGQDSGIRLQSISDAVGAGGPVPAGPVAAGGGATAPESRGDEALRTAAVVMACLALCATAILIAVDIRRSRT